MEQTELNEQSPNQSGVVNATPAIEPLIHNQHETPRAAQVSPATCTTCGAEAMAEANGNGTTVPSYIFAIGRIEPRFPTLAVEKEFAQAASSVNTKGQTAQEVLRAVLTERAHRYIARQVCWVQTIGGLETYILAPRDPTDLDLLLETVRAEPSPLDMDLVIGTRGPIAPPEMCNGLMVPIVVFDQIYSFNRNSLLKELRVPKGANARAHGKSADELLERILLLVDNAGSADNHRALNYLAVRYPAMYDTVAEAYANDSWLTAVDVQPSPLSGTRNIVDVIFTFTNRKTDVMEKQFTRVDVTEEFPFLVRRMSNYFDR